MGVSSFDSLHLKVHLSTTNETFLLLSQNNYCDEREWRKNNPKITLLTDLQKAAEIADFETTKATVLLKRLTAVDKGAEWTVDVDYEAFYSMAKPLKLSGAILQVLSPITITEWHENRNEGTSLLSGVITTTQRSHHF